MESKIYKKAIYFVEIELSKSPSEVFLPLIDLSKWWPEEFEGGNIQLHTEFVFRTGNSHYTKNKVVDFVPNKKVTWLTTESLRKTDGYDWTSTKFIFELTPKGNSTILTFTYDAVVLDNESDRLIQICDLTVKSYFTAIS